MSGSIIKVPSKKLPALNQTSIVVLHDKEYCIINQNNEYFAIDNLCPHREASLGLGELCQDEIICPLHEFRFNFKTGACNIERYSVQKYTIEIIH